MAAWALKQLLLRMLTRMQTGRFKVFRGQEQWMEEFRYCRREDGLIVQGTRRPDLVDALCDHDAPFCETAAFGGEVQAEAEAVSMGGVTAGPRDVSRNFTIHADSLRP